MIRIVITLSVLLLGSLSYSSNLNINDYIDLIRVYYKFRSVFILTHFSCFSIQENVAISVHLSADSVQSRFITNYVNIFNLVDTPKNTIQGYVIDMTCTNYQHIFTQEDHKILFKNNHFWLFIDAPQSEDKFDTSLNYEMSLGLLNILPISEVIVAKRKNVNATIKTAKWFLYDVYRIASNYPLEISLFGQIMNDVNDTNIMDAECLTKEKNNKLSVTKKFLSKSTRDDLKGLTLTCGLVIAYPEIYTYLEDPNVENVDIFTKTTATVAANLRENLNMRCDIIQVDNYGWNMNGTFNGVMGLFQTGKIQALSHATIMREDRLKYVEFTAELFVIETPIIFRQPPLSAISNIFILPLDIDVWRCYFVLMVIVTLIMLTQKIHPMFLHNLSLLDVITFVLGAVCQQGTNLRVPTISGRFILLTTFLSTLAIFTSYSASIVALLQSPSHSIKTIDDLLASPLKMGLQEAGYNRYNYLVENISALNKVYEKKIRPMGNDGWIYDPFAGVNKIRTELFAFQVESAAAYKAVARTFTESEKCSLTEIHLLRLAVTTVTVERNSPYKELFKRRLRFQRENGLMNRAKRRWFPKKPICEGVTSDLKAVGINEVQPALKLLAMGVFLSFLIMLLEIVVQKILKCNLQKINGKAQR